MIKKNIPVILFLLMFIAGTAQASTKATVVKRGYLECGVSTGLTGFSDTDQKGNWSGLDIDICRAVAAAVLGDAGKVKFISLMAKERATALLSGKVDILTRNTTWTLTRDTGLGLHFAGISFFDRLGYLVAKQPGVKSIKELDGAVVCAIVGTDAERNLTEDLLSRGIQVSPLVMDTPDEVIKAFETGRCSAISAGQAQLYGYRKSLSQPEDSEVIVDLLTKRPYGPIVRQGDDQWLNIVKWTLYAMIYSEELKISSGGIESLKLDPDPRIRRFFGLENNIGLGLGLSNDWAYQVIKQIGNYGESFERNLGVNSPLGISRGLNALWSNGGLLYAPPFR